MKQRRYGLFARQPGHRNWVLVYPELVYPKQHAVRIFQTMLIYQGSKPEYSGWEHSLRPVKTVSA